MITNRLHLTKIETESAFVADLLKSFVGDVEQLDLDPASGFRGEGSEGIADLFRFTLGIGKPFVDDFVTQFSRNFTEVVLRDGGCRHTVTPTGAHLTGVFLESRFIHRMQHTLRNRIHHPRLALDDDRRFIPCPCGKIESFLDDGAARR